ncbi:MAG: hypothetical protein LBK41_03195 [Clostridiales bacterium]|jgi:hypothetical protein|nr:hypothetical protein [Clostridiales bacterium]
MDLMTIVNIILTLLAVDAVVMAVWLGERDDEMPSVSFWTAFGVIAAVAVAVRVFEFGSVPGGFNQDGAMAAVNAKAIIETGRDIYGTRMPALFEAWSYAQMNAFMIYAACPFVAAFGLNPIAARLPSLIISLGGLLALFGLVRALTGNRVAALFTFAFAAINPWHIMQSRWLLEANALPHVMVIAAYFLVKAVQAERGARRWLSLSASMVSFALTLYCYGIAVYTVPLFMAAVCAFLLAARRIRAREAVAAVGVFLLVAWPIIGVYIINVFKLPSLELPFVTLPYFPSQSRSSELLFLDPEPFAKLADNAIKLTRIVLFQRGDGWAHNSIDGFGAYYLPAAPFAAFGVWLTIRRARDDGSLAAFVSLAWLAVGILAGLCVSPNVNRVNLIFYPIIIFAGIGLERAARSRRYIKYGTAAAFAILFGMFCGAYFTDWSDEIKEPFLADFGQALEYAETLDAGEYYITGDSQFAGSVMTSRVLTMFYFGTADMNDPRFIYFTELQPPGESSPGSANFRESSPESANFREAVYVVNAKELDMSEFESYSMKEFGRFIVAEPVRSDSP